MEKAQERLLRTKAGSNKKNSVEYALGRNFSSMRALAGAGFKPIGTGNTQMLSVVCVLVRPSPIFREGLTNILSNSPFKPVWSVSSTQDARTDQGAVGEEGVVLMDVRDGGTAWEALNTAKAMFSDVPIVMVGDSGKRDLVSTALKSGATSFIDENVTASTLIRELELIAQGEPVISILILKRLLGHQSAPPCDEAALPIPAGEPQERDAEEAGSKPHLSDREAVILKALVQGTSNKVIASRMNITEGTVKVHVKAILRKIRVRNRTQAAIWALRRYTLPEPAHRGNDEMTLTEGAESNAR
jgi:two-component system nitrate/nitrite response regulator NarL